MKRCALRVPPRLGTAVIFNTDRDSFHGQPDPVTCPPGRSRRSMALYYYTAPPEGVATIAPRITTFQVRPNSRDKTDWFIKKLHFKEDWIPPALLRMMRKAKRALLH